MAKYVMEVEAFTFQDLIDYGKANGVNIVDDMPWSFEFKGVHVSHENDNCYIIAPCYHFTPDFMLIHDKTYDALNLMLISDFNKLYTKVPE